MLGAAQAIKCYLPLVFAILLAQIPTILGIEAMKCAVCRSLVGEIDFKIGEIDPKKKVQVGSYRVDPQGNQKTHEVSFGRSEVHLVDVMDTLCDSMKHYAETTNNAGKKSVIRTLTYSGEALSLDNFKINKDVVHNLQTLCDDMLDDYEEKMINIMRREDIKDHETRICRDIIRVCTSDDMKVPMPTAPLREDVEKEAEERAKLRAEEEEEEDEEVEKEKEEL